MQIFNVKNKCNGNNFMLNVYALKRFVQIIGNK